MRLFPILAVACSTICKNRQRNSVAILKDLEDETLEIIGFWHGQKHGMIGGLTSLLKQTHRPIGVLRRLCEYLPQIHLRNMVGARTRDKDAFWSGQSKSQQIDILITCEGPWNRLFAALCHADGTDSERGTQTTPSCGNEFEKSGETIKTILRPVAKSSIRPLRATE